MPWILAQANLRFLVFERTHNHRQLWDDVRNSKLTVYGLRRHPLRKQIIRLNSLSEMSSLHDLVAVRIPVLAPYLIRSPGRGLPGLRCSPILVMQASKDRDGLDVCRGTEDLTERLAFRDLNRSALFQPLMRTRFDEVAGVLGQDAPQVLLAENEDVVEALSPDGAEEVQ